MKTNKKVITMALMASVITGSVFAQGSNTGLQNTSNGNYGLVIGTSNTTTVDATSSFVAGHGNTVTAPNAIAFGTNNTANGENAFVGGNDAKAKGRNSFAFGAHAESLVEYTIAIGNQARTAAYDTVAIGNGAYVSGESSVVIGRTNNVTGENTVVLGANNKDVAGGQSAVVGYNNKVGTDKEQLVFGSNSETNAQGAIVVGTHAKATAMDATSLGNNTIADKHNAVAIGTNSVTDDPVGVDGITINGTRHAFAGEQPSSVVSFGSQDRPGAGGVKHYNRQLQNVAAGRVEADSLDAINGSQLYAAIDEINTNGKQVKKNKENIEGVAIGLNMLGDIVNDHETAINNNGNRITALGNRVDTNAADIRVLHDTATNHEGRITTLERQVNNNQAIVNSRINGVDKRINRLGASSAALAGLHPLDFNKNDKASYAISYGHYNNSNAVAVGAFYRPNERIMVGIGASLGSENQYTANIAFKFGKGSDYLAEAKGKDARIERLEAMVNQLMAERGK